MIISVHWHVLISYGLSPFTVLPVLNLGSLIQEHLSWWGCKELCLSCSLNDALQGQRGPFSQHRQKCWIVSDGSAFTVGPDNHKLAS